MKDLYNNLAVVFPGQGSQSVGMLSELAASHSEVGGVFGIASDALGYDLWDLASNGPAEKQNLTEHTQPLMLAAGVAVWEVWQKSTTVRPGWMAGHSLGEYTALVCAGAISLQDAVRLVAERARLMQEAVPPGSGAMAAILGLKDSQVVQICSEVAGSDVVAPVNFNAPGQVVIAGHAHAVDRAIKAASETGAKRAVVLPVSVPSHCALMQAAAQELDKFIRKIEIKTPQITVIHNVDVASHTSEEVIRSVLKEQLYKPVRWVESVKFMYEQGVTSFIECGPGKVLSGLNKRIVRDAEVFSVFDNETLNKALEHVE